jgi:hypothetical protein
MRNFRARRLDSRASYRQVGLWMWRFCSTGIAVVVGLVSGGCSREACSTLIETYGWSVPARGIEPPAAAVARITGDTTGAVCRSSDNPWRGPGLCGPGAVLQPSRGKCSVWNDISPKIDRNGGFYRADRDRKNWVPLDGGNVLELLAAYVVDNGEGDEELHGPHGNLHWDVFGPFEPLMESKDHAGERRVATSFVLRGPHRTHGTTDEWLDDEALMYSGAGLFHWGGKPGTQDAIVLRVWESDGSEDGALGRRNDVLGMEYIRRQDTENQCGTWVPFHRYTGGHPRNRTARTVLWLLVRTRPADSYGILARLAGETL